MEYRQQRISLHDASIEINSMINIVSQGTQTAEVHDRLTYNDHGNR